MGHSTHRNPEVTHPFGHPGAKDPSVVMARDQAEDVHGPSQARGHYTDGTVCSGCGSVVAGRRWTLDPLRARLLVSAGTPDQVVCPVCRKEAELPAGILTLRGDYWLCHRDEILNLIRNEGDEARRDNPLERILALREEKGGLVVETTNEKLAQKIGRSVEKAHKGQIRYRWGNGNPLVRVDWERSL